MEKFMEKKFAISVINFLISVCMGSMLYAQDNNDKNCNYSTPEEVNILFYSKVTPYVPSVDRQGNPILGPEEAYFEKAQHYYEAYKNFDPVYINFDAFEPLVMISKKLGVERFIYASSSSVYGFLAIILAAVNIFGGFLVTQRMLAMYKKKKKDK